MTWQLRRAATSDLDAIMQLERATFGSDAWSADTMRAELEGPHTYYLVAHPVGQPAELDGYAGLLSPRGAPEADIQTIAVSERARRRGLGRTLMNALVSEARDRGAREVFLEVRADNPGAAALYANLGFEKLSVRTAYYQPDGIDAHIMRLRIRTPETTIASRETGAPDA
ncbi:MAG TPA: ribosomal protein S18-alanine N-acetyltransferase [Terrimesophilobacter sp.]|nr:ribosomal protein S18-alanine N-acetyltransferase [Terrimesophilobacter sp.]